MARRYAVIGKLCGSRKQAETKLKELNALTNALFGDQGRLTDWGVADIEPAKGDSPSKISKIHLPPPPALLKRLEGLLSNREVRKTKAGAEALKLVRESLRRS